ncbi:MAG: helix-turn-helix domain-containing protein [Rhodospirillales bacterium]|nr:helix-turn-helix domain-containing protein [Rhodospirillales bacterium]
MKRDVTKKPRVEPDADAPLSDDEFARGQGAMLARRARAATGLSQTAFAGRFGIPVSSLRDWEQGRRSPDAATRSYLRVIARMPDGVAKALHNDAA